MFQYEYNSAQKRYDGSEIQIYRIDLDERNQLPNDDGYGITMYAGNNHEAIILVDGKPIGTESSYEALKNLPKINSVELKGNKSSSDFGLQQTMIAGDHCTITDLGDGTSKIDVEGADIPISREEVEQLVAAEEQARINADDIIRTLANSNKSRLDTYDAINISTRLDSAEQDILQNSSDISTLYANIQTEHNERVTADSQLSDSIQQEKVRAVNAETDLEVRVDILESDKVTKTYVDTQDSALSIRIDNKQDKLTAGNGINIDSSTNTISTNLDGTALRFDSSTGQIYFLRSFYRSTDSSIKFENKGTYVDVSWPLNDRIEASTASGSVLIGSNCSSSATNAIACGTSSIAAADSQFVIGKYNKQQIDNNCLFIVGNGTSDSSRSDALSVWSDGSIISSGNFYCQADSSGQNGKKIIPIPEPPTTAGNYTLQAVVTSSGYSLQWV